MTYKEEIEFLAGYKHPDITSYVEQIRQKADDANLPVAVYGMGMLGMLWLSVFESLGVTVSYAVDASRKGDAKGLEILTPDTLHGRTEGRALLVVTPNVICAAERAREAFRSSFERYQVEFIPPSYSGLLAWKHPFACGKIANVLRVVDMLEDDLSKYSYTEYLRRRIMGEDFRPPFLDESQQYIARDLFRLGSGDYIVDCGAYDGDTVERFCREWPKLRGIAAIEPTPEMYEKLRSAAGRVRVPVETLKIATGASTGSGMLYFDSIDAAGNSLSANATGGIPIEICALDSIVADKHPTFIKMDVEGAELDTLKGCRAIIERDKPILAICAYHKPEDVYAIPEFIKRCDPSYKIFARKYTPGPHELILYAVPPNRLMK